MQTLIKITKSHPVQTGVGLLVLLSAFGISADAYAQDPAAAGLDVAQLASNPWALVVGACVVVGGQLAAAWKEHLAGHKARADELQARLAVLEAQLQEARERALRAELTGRS